MPGELQAVGSLHGRMERTLNVDVDGGHIQGHGLYSQCSGEPAGDFSWVVLGLIKFAFYIAHPGCVG